MVVAKASSRPLPGDKPSDLQTTNLHTALIVTAQRPAVRAEDQDIDPILDRDVLGGDPILGGAVRDVVGAQVNLAAVAASSGSPLRWTLCPLAVACPLIVVSPRGSRCQSQSRLLNYLS